MPTVVRYPQLHRLLLQIPRHYKSHANLSCRKSNPSHEGTENIIRIHTWDLLPLAHLSPLIHTNSVIPLLFCRATSCRSLSSGPRVQSVNRARAWRPAGKICTRCPPRRCHSSRSRTGRHARSDRLSSRDGRRASHICGWDRWNKWWLIDPKFLNIPVLNT